MIAAQTHFKYTHVWHFSQSGEKLQKYTLYTKEENIHVRCTYICMDDKTNRKHISLIFCNIFQYHSTNYVILAV